MSTILSTLLTAPLARGPHADVAAFLRVLERCPFPAPVEQAIWGGAQADRLGHAFAAGYVAALARLVGAASDAAAASSSARPVVRSMAATESGGGHPRAIACGLVERDGGLFLDGEKTFATMAPLAVEVLVVASRGAGVDGRNRLCMVRVRPGAAGVTITPRDPTPFAPEIPHARVTLRDVAVAEEDVLPGDGYEDWLKPFRTLEDTHVLAATIGYLGGVARAHDLSRGVQTELVALAAALVEVAARDPRAPLTHLVLAGHFGTARRVVDAVEAEWAAKESAKEEHARWERDRSLLSIAEVVRAKRTEAAFDRIRSTEPS